MVWVNHETESAWPLPVFWKITFSETLVVGSSAATGFRLWIFNGTTMAGSAWFTRLKMWGAIWLRVGVSVKCTTVGCKSFGRNIRLGFKQQQQDLIYNHLCLRK